MKIKKAEIAGYMELLRSSVDVKNGKWAYAVSRNLKRLESAYNNVHKDYWDRYKTELEIVNEALKKEKKPIIDPQSYIKAKNELITKYSWYEEEVTVKEKGKDVTSKNKKQFIDNGLPSVYKDNVEEYEKESLILEEDKKTEKEFLEKINNDFEAILDKSVFIDFYKVSEEGVPENISANELIQFDFMLKD